MPNCLGCHTYNVLGRKVCKACGQALPVDEGRDCSHCGSEMGPFAKKCRVCGWEKILNKQSIRKEAPKYTQKNADVDVELSNVFFELERQNFKLNKLEGLNERRDGKSQIKFVGEFDEFTISTAYEHYEVIAKNLKVYPTVTIYERTHQLGGGFGGFYHNSNHHIEMVDHYFLVSILSHEMRHAFQYTYFPSLFYKNEYSTAKGYLDSKIERDAREYSIAYCEANGLYEEKNELLEHERQIELVINGELPISAVNLENQYFHENPQIAQIYNQDSHNGNEESTTIYYEEDDGDGDYYGESPRKSGWFSRFVKGALGVVIFLFLLGSFFSDDDEEGKVNLSKDLAQYVLENSAVKNLTDEDLNKLSKEELRIARNEIYARHGFVFGKGDLQEYFSKQSWYTPNDKFTESLLSELEHKNVSFIQQYEKQKGK